MFALITSSEGSFKSMNLDSIAFDDIDPHQTTKKMPWLLCDPVKVAIPGHAKSAQEPSIETSRCPKFFEMAFTSSMSMILFLGKPPNVEEEEEEDEDEDVLQYSNRWTENISKP